VRIEVLDRGSGMNDAVLTNALVPFYSTKRSGTGLGLALAREIAEAHGGRITLANRDGGGLAVTMILPVDQVLLPALPGCRCQRHRTQSQCDRICEALFGAAANDERLHVRQMDALDFVLDRANHGTVDVLQVDLYDEEARGPVLDRRSSTRAASTAWRKTAS
jgi:hypothetical protein